MSAAAIRSRRPPSECPRTTVATRPANAATFAGVTPTIK